MSQTNEPMPTQLDLCKEYLPETHALIQKPNWRTFEQELPECDNKGLAQIYILLYGMPVKAKYSYSGIFKDAFGKRYVLGKGGETIYESIQWTYYEELDLTPLIL